MLWGSVLAEGISTETEHPCNQLWVAAAPDQPQNDLWLNHSDASKPQVTSLPTHGPQRWDTKMGQF